MNETYKWPDIQAPVAAKKSKQLTAHNDVRDDEYYWLNERESPEVLDYLKAENKYTDSMLSGTKQLQDKLFTEMKSRIQEKDETVPFFKNGYWYYTRYEEGAQYALHCRKKQSLTAPEEIFLDQNKLAGNLKYFKVGAYSISDDNRLFFSGPPCGNSAR